MKAIIRETTIDVYKYSAYPTPKNAPDWVRALSVAYEVDRNERPERYNVLFSLSDDIIVEHTVKFMLGDYIVKFEDGTIGTFTETVFKQLVVKIYPQ